MRALVYDLEIVKAIQGKEPRVPGVDYCKGWTDHAGMGISTLCAWDSGTKRWRVFCDDNRAQFFEAVAAADWLVSWNGIKFDNMVIAACWDFEMPPEKQYDLLCEAKIAANLTPFARKRGFKLNQFAEANFGAGKTDDAAMAPVNWQRGNIGAVIDYCLQDVRLTARLWRMVLAGTPLKSAEHGDLTLEIPTPQEAA